MKNIRPFLLVQHAFRRFLRVYVLKTRSHDITALFINNHSTIKRLIKALLNELTSIKLQLCCHVIFVKINLSQKAYFCSEVKEISSESLIDGVIESCQNDIDLLSDVYTARGSGWILSSIDLLEVRVGMFIPHKGGCYKNFGSDSLNKKACINIKTDEDCFMFAVLAGLHPAPFHAERTNWYIQFITRYDWEGVRGVVDLSQINTSERRNQNISINVYTLLSKDVLPLRISQTIREHHINLLLHKDHFFLIKNFNRLCSSRSIWKRYFCYNCLQGFRNNEALDTHKKFCRKPQKVVLPSLGTNLQYTSFHKEIKFPCVIYGDFETLAIPTNKDQIYQKHEPSSYCYVIVDWLGKIIFSDFYRGKDTPEKFISSLLFSRMDINNYIQSNKKRLKMTPDEELLFKQAQDCWLCQEALNDDRVRDHDHFTGKFRGAAHNSCNLKYSLPKKIPILFHNLKNFDSHIIIQALNISKNHFILLDNFSFNRKIYCFYTR